MARTYRFRKEGGYVPWFATMKHKRYYITPNWEPSAQIYFYWYSLIGKTLLYKVPYPKQHQLRIDALEHRDQRFSVKEPGPSKFRNIMEERPLRRSSKNELHKWFKDCEYEPIIDSRQRKRVYYT